MVAMLSTAERLKSTVFQRNIKNVHAIKCLVVDGDCRAGVQLEMNEKRKHLTSELTSTPN